MLVLHMTQILPKSAQQFCQSSCCFACFDTFEFIRLQCPHDKIYDDVVLADRFAHQLTKLVNRLLVGYLDSFMFIMHMNRYVKNHRSILLNFHMFCMIWYWWVHSYSVSKQQGIRWCSFHCSISILIDYIRSVYIDRAITTTWYSYCIWNSYIKITSGNRYDEGNDHPCWTVLRPW